MNIYEYQNDRRYQCMISSDRKIFITYLELLDLAEVKGIDTEVLLTYLHNEYCPSAINHDEGREGNHKMSIWMYERMDNFLDLVVKWIE